MDRSQAGLVPGDRLDRAAARRPRADVRRSRERRAEQRRGLERLRRPRRVGEPRRAGPRHRDRQQAAEERDRVDLHRRGDRARAREHRADLRGPCPPCRPREPAGRSSAGLGQQRVVADPDHRPHRPVPLVPDRTSPFTALASRRLARGGHLRRADPGGPDPGHGRLVGSVRRHRRCSGIRRRRRAGGDRDRGIRGGRRAAALGRLARRSFPAFHRGRTAPAQVVRLGGGAGRRGVQRRDLRRLGRRLGDPLGLAAVPVRRDRDRDGEAQPLRHRRHHQQDDHVRGARGVHHRDLRGRGGRDRRGHRRHRGRLAARDRGRRRGVPADPATGATDRQPARLRGARDALRGPVQVLRARRRDLLGRGHPRPDGAAPRGGDGRHVGRGLAPGGRRGPPGRGVADERRRWPPRSLSYAGSRPRSRA